ncbi:MAG: PASTA domain-containing protein, partial [Acidimicrobiales bacterium]
DTFDKGTTVDLVISGGPELRFVPDLVNMTPEDATALLEPDGLLLSVVGEAFSETVAKGIIVSANIPPGTEVERGTVIEVTTSKGPDRRTVPVLLGETFERAKELLENAGLKVGNVAKRQDNANIVFATGTGQEAGTKHAPGTPIDLVLN